MSDFTQHRIQGEELTRAEVERDGLRMRVAQLEAEVQRLTEENEVLREVASPQQRQDYHDELAALRAERKALRDAK